MNFSHKGIQNRKHQLESAATHRLHKLQLIGIRLTLIGLIFGRPFCRKFPDWNVYKHFIFDAGCELYPDCSKGLYNDNCGQ